MASHEIVDRALQQGRTLLTETESKQILQDLGIATTLGHLVTSEERPYGQQPLSAFLSS